MLSLDNTVETANTCLEMMAATKTKSIISCKYVVVLFVNRV